MESQDTSCARIQMKNLLHEVIGHTRLDFLLLAATLHCRVVSSRPSQVLSRSFEICCCS